MQSWKMGLNGAASSVPAPGTERTPARATFLQQGVLHKAALPRAEEWTVVVLVGHCTAELAQKEKCTRK